MKWRNRIGLGLVAAVVVAFFAFTIRTRGYLVPASGGVLVLVENPNGNAYWHGCHRFEERDGRVYCYDADDRVSGWYLGRVLEMETR